MIFSEDIEHRWVMTLDDSNRAPLEDAGKTWSRSLIGGDVINCGISFALCRLDFGDSRERNQEIVFL